MFKIKRTVTIEKINIEKQDICFFLFFSIVGLITFSSMIIHELPNPDAIWNDLYYKESWAWECQLGRYMICFFQLMFGNVINSSTFTILCVLLLAAICVIVIKLFAVSGIMAVLCGMMLIFSPAMVSTLSYYYCSLYYMIAYLLAVIATWIMCKCEDWLSACIGIVLLCISMATYQAYIGVVLTLALMFVILLLLDKSQDLKVIFNRIFYMLMVVAGGIISYLISCKLAQKITGIAAESGRGFSEMGSIPLERLGNLLKSCYIYTYQYFFSTEMINNEYGFKKILNYIIVFVFIFAFSRELIKSEKSWYYKVLTVIGIFLLPVALMSITIAGSGVSIYDTTGVIMLPTMNYGYVLLILLLCRTSKKQTVRINCLKWCGGMAILMMMISLFSFCMSAQTYQKHYMNKMDYLAKSIVYDIEKQVDNSHEYSVCFVGQAENGNYPEMYPELFDSLHWVTASHRTVWKNFLGIQECWKMYIKQYTGKWYTRCSEEEYNQIINSEFFSSMNNYPDSNSVAVYNDSIVVIRLSDA